MKEVSCECRSVAIENRRKERKESGRREARREPWRADNVVTNRWFVGLRLLELV
jgi:hypothetical protein